MRLALEVGLDEVIAAARDLGIDAPLQKTPSLALGSSEVSLLDLTGAYASVRAGVTPIQPWGIAAFGSEDQLLFKVGPSVKPRTSLEPYNGTMVGLLKLVVDRGTGRAAGIDRFAAGKLELAKLSRCLVRWFFRIAGRRCLDGQRRRYPYGQGNRWQAPCPYLETVHD